MASLTFARSSARNAANIAANPSRLLNLYFEPVEAGGKTGGTLWPAYGMNVLSDLDGVFVRDMIEYGGYLYAILPGALYRVSGTGAVRIGSAALGGTAALSRNLNAVTGCIGGTYYVWNTTTTALSTPSTGGIGGVAWVEYLAGRTIIGEVGTGKFGWSAVADPTSFPGANVATAEAREDAIIRGMVSGNTLYLFGQKTIELWGASSFGANSFAPLQIVLERGLKSFALACRCEGAIFAIGDDDVAYLVAGNAMQAVSTPSVNEAVRNGEPQSCMYWEERGHKFCAITFRDRPTWVYDLATNLWWERCETPQRMAWRGRVAAKLGDEWVIGADDGSLYTMQPTATDAGAQLYREATSFVLQNDDQWFTLAELEVKTGAGFSTAEIALEVGSQDGGAIKFGRPHIMALPGVGAFNDRAIFRRLGRHKEAVARLSMTGAVIPIYADCRVRLA